MKKIVHCIPIKSIEAMILQVGNGKNSIKNTI